MIFGVPLAVLFGQLLIGIINGAFYALLSLGLAVIFGLLKIINFAHGVMYMLGAMVTVLMFDYLGVNYWVALLLAPLLVGAFGVAIEYFLLRRIAGQDHIYSLLLTFGVALIIMAVGVAGAMIFKGIDGSLVLNELSTSDFKNMHQNPGKNILYPMMFIVISCGAISGFHSTQAPLMARCLKKERHGRKAFYGAMIAEGIVAIIWATAAMNYFGDVHGLADAMNPEAHNPAWVVNEISQTWLGKVGGFLAILGVIACPITTGDTAFRSARLTIADMFKYSQSKLSRRLIVSIPLFVGGFIMSQLEFATIWKYLGLSNQILAVIVLWTAAMYLALKGKNHFLISIPATFLTSVCVTYLLVAPVKNGGLYLSTEIGYPAGVVVALMALVWFVLSARKMKAKY